MKTFFVFDVESIGLHGEGYAVAGGVYHEDGTTEKGSEFVAACDPYKAKGSVSDREWVAQNVPYMKAEFTDPKSVRDEFWKRWIEAKTKNPNIIMAAECGWPVETNFLSACVADDTNNRTWSGPYPLHEISSFLVAGGMDPMATYDRLDSEMPKHHPLMDSRQSARLLYESLHRK